MFTAWDKALTAVVMGGAYLINHFTSFHFALSEDSVTGMLGFLTPILVWWIPNLKP